MSERIRLPNISASTDKGKVEQIGRYLYQLALQLDRLLGEGGAGDGTVVVQTEDAQTMFAQLKPLILQSKDIVDSIKKKLEGSFADAQDIEDYVSKWLRPVEDGVELGSTAEDGTFTAMVKYSADNVYIYCRGSQVAVYSKGRLTVQGAVEASCYNGVYVAKASPDRNLQITVQTKYKQFEDASGRQVFLVFGTNGSAPFSAAVQVNRTGTLGLQTGTPLSVFSIGENGSFIITGADRLDVFTILSAEAFAII